MVGGATGDDDDPLRAEQLLVAERADVIEVDAVFTNRPVSNCLSDRIGLLVDLLQHEGLVTTLLSRLLIPIDGHDLTLDRLAARRRETSAARAHGDDLPIFDVLHAPRLREEGWYRRGEEHLPFPDADDQRALLARTN